MSGSQSVDDTNLKDVANPTSDADEAVHDELSPSKLIISSLNGSIICLGGNENPSYQIESDERVSKIMASVVSLKDSQSPNNDNGMLFCTYQLHTVVYVVLVYNLEFQRVVKQQEGQGCTMNARNTILLGMTVSSKDYNSKDYNTVENVMKLQLIVIATCMRNYCYHEIRYLLSKLEEQNHQLMLSSTVHSALGRGTYCAYISEELFEIQTEEESVGDNDGNEEKEKEKQRILNYYATLESFENLLLCPLLNLGLKSPPGIKGGDDSTALACEYYLLRTHSSPRLPPTIIYRQQNGETKTEDNMLLPFLASLCQGYHTAKLQGVSRRFGSAAPFCGSIEDRTSVLRYNKATVIAASGGDGDGTLMNVLVLHDDDDDNNGDGDDDGGGDGGDGGKYTSMRMEALSLSALEVWERVLSTVDDMMFLYYDKDIVTECTPAGSGGEEHIVDTTIDKEKIYSHILSSYKGVAGEGLRSAVYAATHIGHQRYLIATGSGGDASAVRQPEIATPGKTSGTGTLVYTPQPPLGSRTPRTEGGFAGRVREFFGFSPVPVIKPSSR